MTLSLTGSWTNSYGSKMDIQATNEGVILGEYSSTTGSSGTYYIIGYCGSAPRPADIKYLNGKEITSPSKGQPFVLSIYWRAIDQGSTYDSSWHWVSTYCGQFHNNGLITLLNSLVATTTFETILPGDYVDKLTFNKLSDTPSFQSPNLALEPALKDESNPINGSWEDEVNGAKLFLKVMNKKTGLISGNLEYQSFSIEMWGFTDTHMIAGQEDIGLQSISLSGYLKGSNSPISISGQFQVKDELLQLTRWLANSTSSADSYLQANIQNWRMKKV